MKRLLLLIAVFLMVGAFTGCGDEPPVSNNPDNISDILVGPWKVEIMRFFQTKTEARMEDSKGVILFIFGKDTIESDSNYTGGMLLPKQNSTYKWLDKGNIEVTNKADGSKNIVRVVLEGDRIGLRGGDTKTGFEYVLVRYTGKVPLEKQKKDQSAEGAEVIDPNATPVQ